MNDYTLKRARSYEKEKDGWIPESNRSVFHLTPLTGWMNDPNGFSRYQGKYHMFYQYFPYDSIWGSMHWGHAVSEDLLQWEYLPAALAPEDSYDKDGCFSGSATELPDGRQLLIYTGVRAEESDRQIFQTQCLALGDGKDFQKYEKNPVIGGDMVPAGDSLADFRDPKIWREADGSYRCIAANRMADENGQILMFGSEDVLSWRFLGTLLKSDGHFGKMWECPDFFALDGEHVLLISPQDMLPEGLEYHNGDGTVCLIGEYDSSAVRFTPRHHQAIDYGIDFYAPQTVLTEDGRRVMIGWMQNWDARAIVHERQCLVEGDGAELNLRIILDRFSVEVFVDDGRKTMTATMYTELSADGISFRCEGRARMDVKQYQIEIG